MPAQSKKQRRFMGMVEAKKSGKMKDVSGAVNAAAESMSMPEVQKFSRTKEKGLPVRKKKNILRVMGY